MMSSFCGFWMFVVGSSIAFLLILPPFPKHEWNRVSTVIPHSPPSCSEQWFVSQLNGTSPWMPWSWYLLIQENPAEWIPYQWSTNYSAWTLDEWQQVLPSLSTEDEIHSLLDSYQSDSLTAVTHTLWIPRLVPVNTSTAFLQQNQYTNARSFHPSVCPELEAYQQDRWTHSRLLRWIPWLFPRSVHWIEWECFAVEWIWFLVASYMNQYWDMWSDEVQQRWHSKSSTRTCWIQGLYLCSLLIRGIGWIVQCMMFYCLVVVPFLYVIPSLPYPLVLGGAVALVLQQVAGHLIE